MNDENPIMMGFDAALTALKVGLCIGRDSWNPTTYIHINRENKVIEMVIGGNTLSTPWLPSQKDLLSEDWSIVHLES